MKRTRKLLAIFLVVCMIASYAPAAFADGEEATALAGDEVVVTITDNGGSVSFTATLDGEQVVGGVVEGAIEQTITDANTGIVGAGVATEEGGTGTPNLEAGSIESTVNGDVGSSGAYVLSVTNDNTSAEASLTVNGNISSEHGYGLDVSASSTASDPDVPGTVTAVATVAGDVKDSNSDEYGSSKGVNVNANNYAPSDASFGEATVNVVVNGENGVSAESANLDATGVYALAGENSNVVVSVTDGDVTAATTAENGTGYAAGVIANSDGTRYYDNEQEQFVNTSVTGGTVEVTVAGEVSAVGVTAATGVETSASGKAGSATATVGGGVTASATGGDQFGNAYGARASANNDNSQSVLDIGGSVTAVGLSSAFGAQAETQNYMESSAAITVGGNVTATATGQNGGATGAMTSAEGEKASARLDVGGMVTATGVNGASGVQTQANNKESTAATTVGGNVNATIAGQNGGATGANASASGEKASAGLEIGGMVTATGVNYANGVQTQAQNKESSAAISVGGDVIATATGANGYGSTAGASANASGEKASAVLDIGGQVAASGINNVRSVQLSASNNGAAVTASVKGDVTAAATGEYGYASGVNANAVRENAFVIMDIGGDIKAAGTSYAQGIQTTVSGKNASSAATVSGSVTAATTGEQGSVHGVNIYANGGSSVNAMDIGGNVTATAAGESSSAVGADARASGEKDSASLKIGGDVTATSSYSSVGLQASANGNRATTDVTVDGIVKATVSGEVPEEGNVYGPSGPRGPRGPSVVGVTANANGENAAATATVDGVNVSGGETGSVNGVSVYGYDKANAKASVGEGGIIATGGTALQNTGAVLSVGGDSTVVLEVRGDVTADGEGIVLTVPSYRFEEEQDTEENKPGSIDVLIEGTLSGRDNSILVSSAALKDADVTLTIWQATLNEDGYVIGTPDYSLTREDLKKQLESGAMPQEVYDEQIARIEKEEAESPAIAEELEKNILYIIKVEDNENAALTLAGTTKSHDWDVAKQDETVTLSALVQSGYRLVGVYNGDTLITADADGNYSIVVPKGGGVYYHVQLEKIEPAPSGETYIPVDNKAKEKAEAAKAETDAVKAVEEITAKDQRGEAVVVAVGTLNQMTATETMKKDYESLSDSLVNADKALAAGGQTVIPPEIKALARENATLIAGQAFRCVASSYPATVTVKLDNADSFVGMMIFVNGKWVSLDAVINDDGTVTYTLPGPSILSFVYQEG